MPLSVGDKLGPYEILTQIGEGGMGEVWKARDARLDRTVAIKKLKGEHSSRFEQEAHAIAALNHANICQIHDVGPDYLVMEYIDGQPLRGPLPVEDALRLAIQIASALEEAHGHGMLHRDLKPANILITRAGTAKLLDFGLAKLSRGSCEADATQTIEGAVLGTAAYMAPEQAQGKPLDERSDIFSFGAVLYELLSGRRAFGGGSTLDMLNAVVRDDPVPLQSPAAAIVKRCMAKQASERFQSMTELRKALEQVSAKPVEQQQPSIAVLPFANMSADKDNEYFSDGLAEEIINVLAHIPGLKVIARTSAFAFRGKEQDITKIAEALRVRTILEGSVRRAGNRIRVTAQLISAEDGSHLWSERYDRELADVFAMQDEIAAAIATALKVKLAGQPAEARHYQPNLAAYDAVLRARYHWTKLTPESMVRCRECLEQAIAIDPGYALAHCELAAYFYLLASLYMRPAHEVMPLARAAAERALEIDPTLPEALAWLTPGVVDYDYDWKEAERLHKLAMASEPVSAEVRFHYGMYLFLAGRPEAAAKEVARSLQEDPLNLLFRAIFAGCLLCVGRDADAATETQRILELDENYYMGHSILSAVQYQRGELAEALASAEKAYSLAPWNPSVCGSLAGLLKPTGDRQRAEAVLAKLGDGTAYGTPAGFLNYHLLCSEIDQAADWAEKAIEQRSSGILVELWLPGAEGLRRSPRWLKLAKMMNLS